jgi:hypothetical protein
MLAAGTQSDLPHNADEIFIASSQGGRVFVANTKEFKAIGPIPACDTIRNDLAKQATDVANSGDRAAQDKSNALTAIGRELFKLLCRKGAATNGLCRGGEGRTVADRTAAFALRGNFGAAGELADIVTKGS